MTCGFLGLRQGFSGWGKEGKEKKTRGGNREGGGGGGGVEGGERLKRGGVE